MNAKLQELETSIARATRAKALIEHGLTCRHRELSMCANFRAALTTRLSRSGADAVHTRPGKASLKMTSGPTSTRRSSLSDAP